MNVRGIILDLDLDLDLGKARQGKGVHVVVVAVGSRLVSPSPSAGSWGSALLVFGALVVGFLVCLWVGDRLALRGELNRWLDDLLGHRGRGSGRGQGRGRGWGAPTDQEPPE